MPSRSAGRFLAVFVLSWLAVASGWVLYKVFHAATLADEELYLAGAVLFLMAFFWMLFTVVDSLVVLAVPPQRTAPQLTFTDLSLTRFC